MSFVYILLAMGIAHVYSLVNDAPGVQRACRFIKVAGAWLLGLAGLFTLYLMAIC